MVAILALSRKKERKKELMLSTDQGDFLPLKNLRKIDYMQLYFI
jgi:hypothetical protein